jgi:hypothetical protein
METLITSEPILSEFEQALLVKAQVPQSEGRCGTESGTEQRGSRAAGHSARARLP